MTARSCATCAYWLAGSPPIATATRHIAPKGDVGVCDRNPPTISYRVGIAVSMFPETHADRRCGEWRERPDDAGGGERVDNVIPMRDAA